MNDIHYNLPSSKLSHYVLAGLLSMHSGLVIAQELRQQDHVVNVTGAAYFLESNSATYSRLREMFAGDYGYAATNFGQTWTTPEVSDLLLDFPEISSAALQSLMRALRETYGDVRIDTEVHTDPEEGWRKPVFVIHSGVDDFDVLMDIEDNFFAKASEDSMLRSMLPLVVLMHA